jgi:hypothetical protein
MYGSGVEYVAECFWPGVGETELSALDERARASADSLLEQGRSVRYLGSLLMRTDEVVLCLFAGDADAVRAAAERAHVPFERIVVAERSSWPTTGSTPTQGGSHASSSSAPDLVVPSGRVDRSSPRSRLQ